MFVVALVPPRRQYKGRQFSPFVECIIRTPVARSAKNRRLAFVSRCKLRMETNTEESKSAPLQTSRKTMGQIRSQ